MQALERATAADKAAKKKRGAKSGKANFQNKTGVFATVNGVKNAGCRKGGNKPGHGVGKHSGPCTTKVQTQANFEEFQRNFPEKLPEEAKVEGFHYLELRKIGFRFQNASGRKVARVVPYR